MESKYTYNDLKKAHNKFVECSPKPAKIQKVQQFMKDRKQFAKHYKPKLVSFGPIHHKPEQLRQGEQYKKMWAAAHIGESNQENDDKLYKKIRENIVELKELYDEDVLGDFADFEDDELVWMFFIDGCAVLYFLKNADIDHPEKLKMKIDQMLLVLQDLLLLENQLPYRVLELLTNNLNELKQSMDDFCEMHDLVVLLKNPRKISQSPGVPQHTMSISKELENPTHLLDYLRKYILAKHSQDEDSDACMVLNCICNSRGCKCKISLKKFIPRCLISKTPKGTEESESISRKTDPKSRWPTYRNIEDLKAAGIRVKRNKNASLQNISFCSHLFAGYLYLPPLIVDDSTAPMLHNLIAYEMCPDFENEFNICSYVKFLDSLIDREQDVKELRSASILQNSLGSDKEVAEMFNNISNGLVLNPRIYRKVRSDMENHYRSRSKTWFAEAYYTHFRSPWTILACLAAALALILTGVQTWQEFEF